MARKMFVSVAYEFQLDFFYAVPLCLLLGTGSLCGFFGLPTVATVLALVALGSGGANQRWFFSWASTGSFAASGLAATTLLAMRFSRSLLRRNTRLPSLTYGIRFFNTHARRVDSFNFVRSEPPLKSKSSGSEISSRGILTASDTLTTTTYRKLISKSSNKCCAG
jgi:hypothetical protein